ncbi:hypothetical protein [Streptomyces sp. NPDC088350]|uniref:hypothetical protein n=1 Tax=Streptomyces sp. NPDC088350 TaxID=3365854 RepID=UPI003814D6E1
MPNTPCATWPTFLDGGRKMTAVLDKARGFLPPPEDDPLRRVLEWMAEGLYDMVADSWGPLARQAAASDDRAAPAPHRELDELLTTWCRGLHTQSLTAWSQRVFSRVPPKMKPGRGWVQSELPQS